MDPQQVVDVSLFAQIMTIATFAVVPWAIAQLTIRWNPQLQRDRGKRNAFRAATAAIALLLTLPSIPAGAGPWFYLTAIVAAVVLDVHWARYAHTETGKRHLQDAKQDRRQQREDRAERATRKATP